MRIITGSMRVPRHGRHCFCLSHVKLWQCGKRAPLTHHRNWEILKMNFEAMTTP